MALRIRICTYMISVTCERSRPQATSRTAAASSTSLRMGFLKEADFVPSEEWLGEYMGQQGLRYALNKTPDEVEKEGKLFNFSLFFFLFFSFVVFLACERSFGHQVFQILSREVLAGDSARSFYRRELGETTL